MVLHIIFVLLKIIGCILLAILGILVLLLLTVLFAAVKYKGEARAAGTLESIEGKLELHWLFHLIRGYVNYERGKLSYELKVLWKCLAASEKEEPVEELLVPEEVSEAVKEAAAPEVSATESRDVAETSKEPTEETPEELLGETSEKPADEIPEEPLKEIPEETSEQEEKASAVQQIPEALEGKEKKDSIFKRISAWYDRIKTKVRQFFRKIKYTIQILCDKINTLSEKAEQVKRFLTDEIHVAAFHRGVREIKRLIKFLNPKRLEAELHFGFEDPYRTGQVLAAAAFLYPFTAEHISLDPDFEQAVLEGEVKVEGRIRVVYFAVVAAHLLLDKNIRLTYRHIRKMMA